MEQIQASSAVEISRKYSLNACFVDKTEQSPKYIGFDLILEATIAGVPDPLTSLIVNLTELNLQLKEILEPYHHQRLDEKIQNWPGGKFSLHILTRHFWDLLNENLHLENGRLQKLRVFQTPQTWAEVKRNP